MQCDRLPFIPAGYDDSKDILAKEGLSIRFMSDGKIETGAFMAGEADRLETVILCRAATPRFA